MNSKKSNDTQEAGAADRRDSQAPRIGRQRVRRATSEIARIGKRIGRPRPRDGALEDSNAEAACWLQVADPSKPTRRRDRLRKTGRHARWLRFLSGARRPQPDCRSDDARLMRAPENTREMAGILGLRLKDDPTRSVTPTPKDIGHDRERDPSLAELGALRDERRAHFDRRLQAVAAQEGHRGGQAHRQGRRRPRGDDLHDARRGS